MKKMPIIFVGHGSPMNAIEDNEYSRTWRKIGEDLPKPKAILAISAHWYTNETRISDAKQPKMIYDMYGFPKELYEIEYTSPGAPELAHETKEMISKNVLIDNSWGYDHGTWSILHVMYPKADIPVYQLSVDRNASAETHYKIGQEIASLREKGVLIFASGNAVHNLAYVDFSMQGGYDWAIDFDQYIKEKIVQRDYAGVMDYKKAGKSAELSFTSPDHFYPLLYILGASSTEDELKVYNESCTMGALSMTSYLFEQ